MTKNRVSYLLGAVLGSAVVLASAPGALAADIYDNSLKGGYDVAPVETDRGIYIKGYVGQANPDVGSIWNEFYDDDVVDVRHKDIKSSPLYGIGIGWRARHWLRFDLTGEYRGDALFVAHDVFTGFSYTNEYTADVKSWLGLANAYWDIANWCGFTPYLGAGIGFSTINVSGLKDVNVPLAGVAFGADNTTTNFAWALYAGVAFDVSPNVVIDLSYRYADLGNAESGPVSAYNGDPAGFYSGHHINDITSNDLLLGVRYKFQRDEPVVVMK